jgi:hypothetical protein
VGNVRPMMARLFGVVVMLQGCSSAPPPPAAIVGSWQARQAIDGIVYRHVLGADGTYRVQEFGPKSGLLISDEGGRYWVDNGSVFFDSDLAEKTWSTRFAVVGETLSLEPYEPVGEHDDVVGAWRFETDATDPFGKWARFNRELVFDSDATRDSDGQVTITDRWEGDLFPRPYTAQWKKKLGIYQVRLNGNPLMELVHFGNGLTATDSIKDRVK